VQAAPTGPCSVHAMTVAANVGRVYALASGDFNPIHLHPATARVFGMRSAIAHGMWSVARLLAAFGAEHSARVEANFYKPLRLPSTVEMRRAPGSQELWCVSAGGEHTHVGLLIA
jgi:acyl dehydratase